MSPTDSLRAWKKFLSSSLLAGGGVSDSVCREQVTLSAALWPRRAHRAKAAALSQPHFSPLCSRPGTLHDFHSHEIAEQLTLLDAELFYKIEVCTEWPSKGRLPSA